MITKCDPHLPDEKLADSASVEGYLTHLTERHGVNVLFTAFVLQAQIRVNSTNICSMFHCSRVLRMIKILRILL